MVPVSRSAHRRLVIADDHKLLREGVKLLLSQRPDFEVAAEAEDGLQLLECLQAGCAPDVVILDITMPRMNGLETAREIRKHDSNIRILILTMHRDEEMLWQALMAGVDGYLLKENLASELLPALDSILQSSVYISPLFAGELDHAWLKTFLTIKADHPEKPLSTGEIELLRDLKTEPLAKVRGLPE
jgi:two-component system, NarL family, response regulator NreC